MRAPNGTRPATLLTTIADELNIDSREAVLVRHHGTQVWHLPSAEAIVRIAPAHHARAAARSVAIARWAHENAVPATEPLTDQVFQDPGQTATVWRYYPQPTSRRPTSADLGDLLSRLHRAGAPEIELPKFTPLRSLRTILRRTSTLPNPLVEGLHGRIDDLLNSYSDLHFPLGRGLIHGDAWLGNVLFDGDRPLLGDWDECAMGPRELDLANLWQGRRFGRTRAELDAFSDAYGHDLSDWDGLDVLVRIRDLHTLGSYVRAADRGDEGARAQLLYRISTLDDRSAVWTSR